MTSPSTASSPTIRRIASESEAWAAADIMASSSPWQIYGRGREGTFKQVTHPAAETYVAIQNDNVIGVVIVAIEVPLVRGYIWALAVHPNHRNQGLGTKLLKHAEERIFRESPNVFICVTSFNTSAHRLYTRLGYTQVGLLENYVLDGVHEHLLRKTLGPTKTYYGPQQPSRES